MFLCVWFACFVYVFLCLCVFEFIYIYIYIYSFFKILLVCCVVLRFVVVCVCVFFVCWASARSSGTPSNGPTRQTVVKGMSVHPMKALNNKFHSKVH